jgi:hypothetical protein
MSGVKQLCFLIYMAMVKKKLNGHGHKWLEMVIGTIGA